MHNWDLFEILVVNSVPSSYLEMPLGSSLNAKVVKDDVVRRFERKKVVSWKRQQYSSKGGRFALN